MATCNACGDNFDDRIIVSNEEFNTGKDTICMACHAECVADDRMAIRANLVDLSNELLTDGGEPEWQQYLSDRQLQDRCQEIIDNE